MFSVLVNFTVLNNVDDEMCLQIPIYVEMDTRNKNILR